MMQHSFAIALSILAFVVGRAAAHGVASKIVIGSTTYQGQSGSESPVRAVTNKGDPIYDLTSTDLLCGAGAAQFATQTATANPGDLIQIYMANEQGGFWPHTDGPIQAYFANCGGDCNNFVVSASTNFFKTSELLKTEEDTNNWVQAALTTGAPINLTVPLQLAAGNYIVRYEILSLQLAMTPGEAEFYPGCMQLSVGGSQAGTPDSTMNMIGSYTATNPGILFDVYDDISSTYVPPGGPVSNLVDPLSNTNDDVNNAVAVAGGSAPSSPSVAVPGPNSSSASAASSSTPVTSSSSSSSLSTAPSAAVPVPIINVAPNPSNSSGSSNSSSSATTKQCKRNLRKRSFELDDLAGIKNRGVSTHRKRRLNSY